MGAQPTEHSEEELKTIDNLISYLYECEYQMLLGRKKSLEKHLEHIGLKYSLELERKLTMWDGGRNNANRRRLRKAIYIDDVKFLNEYREKRDGIKTKTVKVRTE